jgi:hypothetical protein
MAARASEAVRLPASMRWRATMATERERPAVDEEPLAVLDHVRDEVHRILHGQRRVAGTIDERDGQHGDVVPLLAGAAGLEAEDGGDLRRAAACVEVVADGDVGGDPVHDGG